MMNPSVGEPNFALHRVVDWSKVPPDIRQVLEIEKEALESNNAEWLAKSLLGKTSRETVTNQEWEDLFYRGIFHPTSTLYLPRLRPADIPHSDRLKKAIPITSTNRPVSPAVAESLTEELLNLLKLNVNIEAFPKDSYVVMGKYTGGLVLGLVAALKLGVPFATLTKRPFNFQLPKDIQVLHIPEPHIPKTNPEYYSHVVVPLKRKVLFLDDEATTGKVIENTKLELEKASFGELIGAGVLLESTPEVRERMKRDQIPFYSLSKLSDVEEELDLSPGPVQIPFQSPVPMKVGRIDFSSFSSPDIEFPLQMLVLERSTNAPFFVDHPFRGMTMALSFEHAKDMADHLENKIIQMIGPIGPRRQSFFKRNRTLYLIGTTPSGLMGAIVLSMKSRLPLVGAANRPEPKGYETLNQGEVINYIHPDGYTYSLFGLEPGDGAIVVTGELTDGEEQVRLVRALQDKGVEVLGTLCLTENLWYQGKKKFSEATGISVESIATYKINEGLPIRNQTKRAYDALKYSILCLEEVLKKTNPAARVTQARVIPSSLTLGVFLEGSDFDEAFVLVDGLSQSELSNYQDKFNHWMTIGGFHFDNEKNRPPRLLSVWQHSANVKSFELEEMPHVTLYENGSFLTPEEIVSQGEKPFVGMMEKHLARFRWLLSIQEIYPEFVRQLLVFADRTEWRFKTLEKMVSDQENELLSSEALNWVNALEDCYQSGVRSLDVTKDETSLETTISELVEKRMIRFFGNQLVLMWHHRTVRFSDKFWSDRITLTARYPFWEKIHQNVQNTLARSAKSIDVRAPWKDGSKEREYEHLLRAWQEQAGPMTSWQKARLLETFAIPDSPFLWAAAIELALKHPGSMLPALKKRIRQLMSEQLLLFEQRSSDIFSEHQTAFHLMVNLYIKFILARPDQTDTNIVFLLRSILADSRIHLMPPQILQDIAAAMESIFPLLRVPNNKKKVIKFLKSQAWDFRERSRQVARKVLPTILKEQRKEEEDYLHNKFFSERTLMADATTIGKAFEEKRLKGKPISAAVCDWDGTLLDLIFGIDRVIDPEIAFWINWVRKQGKTMVITTAASFDRFYRQTMNPSYVPLPLEEGRGLHVFNESVAFYNGRPVSLQPFSSVQESHIKNALRPLGWQHLDDGRPPRIVFRKSGLSKMQAFREGHQVRAALSHIPNAYLTLTPTTRVNKEWDIKIYYATKAAVFKYLLDHNDTLTATNTIVVADNGEEFGVDHPLMVYPEISLKVDVGSTGIIDGAIKTKSKNEIGGHAFLLGWVAEITKENAEKNGSIKHEIGKLSKEVWASKGISTEKKGLMIERIGTLCYQKSKFTKGPFK